MNQRDALNRGTYLVAHSESLSIITMYIYLVLSQMLAQYTTPFFTLRSLRAELGSGLCYGNFYPYIYDRNRIRACSEATDPSRDLSHLRKEGAAPLLANICISPSRASHSSQCSYLGDLLQRVFVIYPRLYGRWKLRVEFKPLLFASRRWRQPPRSRAVSPPGRNALHGP